jgi:hypothetical protein
MDVAVLFCLVKYRYVISLGKKSNQENKRGASSGEGREEARSTRGVKS